MIKKLQGKQLKLSVYFQQLILITNLLQEDNLNKT